MSFLTPCCRWHLFWHFHTAHALIYGVIAVLWKFLLRQPGQAAAAGVAAADTIISTEVKKELSRRLRTDLFKSTGCISGKVPDVTRCSAARSCKTTNLYLHHIPCKSVPQKLICRSLSDMTMSDWVVFVRVVSPMILLNSGVPECVLKLWSPLRQAAMYFLDYREGQHQQHLIDNAQNLLAQYAKLAEQEVPDCRLNTIQLHNCVVHLPKQVSLYGPSIFRTEFWVERMMQVLKRITKHRTMCSPELVAVGAWLLKQAVAAGVSLEPELLALWDKIDPGTSRFTQPDEFDEDGNCLTSKLSDENSPHSTKV
jgi:hypothetical protein